MKLVSQNLLQELSEQARQAPRRRAHRNLHEDLAEPVQRLLIALQPGTYVAPHRHVQSNKWELMLALTGRVAVLVFEDDGRVQRRLVLSADGPERALEMPPATWHSVVALTPDSVILEIKEGPYVPAGPEAFANWAPREGEAQAADFEAWARLAQPGQRYAGKE